ncbi:MAG: hypothetical protein Q4B70_10180 [Lachnospiraceae bacterium]|nr:hypothetical protein [Lachnospiraceae bacterium]
MTGFELNYGKGLIELFQTPGGGFTVTAFVTNVVETIDGYTHGLLLVVCCLLLIWLIYQKTDSVVSIYFVAVLTLVVLKNTIFVEVSTIIFYIIVLSITTVIFSLLKGRVT